MKMCQCESTKDTKNTNEPFREGLCLSRKNNLACFTKTRSTRLLALQLKSTASLKALKIVYKGRRLKKEYVADLVCYDKIVVKLKAMDKLSSRETAQVLNYLQGTKLPR